MAESERKGTLSNNSTPGSIKKKNSRAEDLSSEDSDNLNIDTDSESESSDSSDSGSDSSSSGTESSSSGNSRSTVNSKKKRKLKSTPPRSPLASGPVATLSPAAAAAPLAAVPTSTAPTPVALAAGKAHTAPLAASKAPLAVDLLTSAPLAGNLIDAQLKADSRLVELQRQPMSSLQQSSLGDLGLEGGSDDGFNLETGDQTGQFSLDEFQHLLSVSGEGEGIVDPVFVDHEDSEHAADLDSLVFESEEPGNNNSISGNINRSAAQEVAGIMNEPRLAESLNSASGSLGASSSAEGSLNLNDDEMEEGELPSSPEQDHEEAAAAPPPPPLPPTPPPPPPPIEKAARSSSDGRSSITHHHQHRRSEEPRRSEVKEKERKRSRHRSRDRSADQQKHLSHKEREDHHHRHHHSHHREQQPRHEQIGRAARSDGSTSKQEKASQEEAKVRSKGGGAHALPKSPAAKPSSLSCSRSPRGQQPSSQQPSSSGRHHHHQLSAGGGGGGGDDDDSDDNELCDDEPARKKKKLKKTKKDERHNEERSRKRKAESERDQSSLPKKSNHSKSEDLVSASVASPNKSQPSLAQSKQSNHASARSQPSKKPSEHWQLSPKTVAPPAAANSSASLSSSPHASDKESSVSFSAKDVGTSRLSEPQSSLAAAKPTSATSSSSSVSFTEKSKDPPANRRQPQQAPTSTISSKCQSKEAQAQARDRSSSSKRDHGSHSSTKSSSRLQLPKHDDSKHGHSSKQDSKMAVVSNTQQLSKSNNQQISTNSHQLSSSISQQHSSNSQDLSSSNSQELLCSSKSQQLLTSNSQQLYSNNSHQLSSSNSQQLSSNSSPTVPSNAVGEVPVEQASNSSAASSPNSSSSPHHSEGEQPHPERKSKKLSLKDYKAKKEAERARQSTDGESASQTASNVNSKEPSPDLCQPTAAAAANNSLPQLLDHDGDLAAAPRTGGAGDDDDEEDAVSFHMDETDKFLDGFDVLDEVDGNESEDKSMDEDSDSMDEDIVDELLEKDVVHTKENREPPAREPVERVIKLVLLERGESAFDVMPAGWVKVNHNSGMPLYLHRETRVISASKPYELGTGSVRKHAIPMSAIPCYNYRYYNERYETVPRAAAAAAAATEPPRDTAAHGDQTAGANPSQPEAVNSSQTGAVAARDNGGIKKCPYSFGREDVSPDSTTVESNTASGYSPDELRAQSDGTAEQLASTSDAALSASTTTTTPAGVADAGGRRPPATKFPAVAIESVEESQRKAELMPEEFTAYCRRLFQFKEVEISKFRSWKERRAYFRQAHRKRIENEANNRQRLPEGTKVITIPTLELTNIEGTEGDSALNLQVVKKSKKKWIMNPIGKSSVCLLHEYVQQSLKTQPVYNFTELENASTPYAATVTINQIEYGREVGSSKRLAKARAARSTLEILIPDIKEKLPDPILDDPAAGAASTASNSGPLAGCPDLSFFDDIRVEDPRVTDLCTRTSEPPPYQILTVCLQRNFGFGDTSIEQMMKPGRNGKNEYIMKVNKKEVSVICRNKRDGKQLAAQKLLQHLHPQIHSWGSLLRMYGNRSAHKFKLKKAKETEVTGLQNKDSNRDRTPSQAILEKLRKEMLILREIKKSMVPIGRFVPPEGVRASGLHADHVDL